MDRIFLIGYMGTGKTTLGKALASRLQYDFVDLDWYIENKIQQSISEYFSVNGEVSFRDLENASLQELLTKERVVIATGGGAPCFLNNMSLMLAHGVVVYLEASYEVLFRRLRNAKDQRPIIKNKSEEELQKFIIYSLSQRKVYYEKAQYKINSDNLETEEQLGETVEDLLKIINL